LSSDLQNSRILVTGATGFIGRHLVGSLLRHPGITVHALVRDSLQTAHYWPNGEVTGHAGDLTEPDSLGAVCHGVDTVFHLAGYAHASGVPEGESQDLHRRITIEGTRALLAAAAAAGVKRFVFVSSVKAMGEGGDSCLDESSPAMAASIYGRAKRAAEQRVLQSGRESGMHVSILRLPLVYGHDNKGNLPRMIAAIDRGRFPPLPELGNKRSMVHVEDVVQALLLVAEKPAAGGQIYIVTDGQVYSTRHIYTLICGALGRPVPGWTVPVVLLRLTARFGDWIGSARGRPLGFGSDALDKLIGSAWYSSAKIQHDLGYRPTRNLGDALPEMVAAYRASRSLAQG
jgi:nucleoside-diphosphate-sugar epimerase